MRTVCIGMLSLRVLDRCSPERPYCPESNLDTQHPFTDPILGLSCAQTSSLLAIFFLSSFTPANRTKGVPRQHGVPASWHRASGAKARFEHRAISEATISHEDKNKGEKSHAERMGDAKVLRLLPCGNSAQGGNFNQSIPTSWVHSQGDSIAHMC